MPLDESADVDGDVALALVELRGDVFEGEWALVEVEEGEDAALQLGEHARGRCRCPHAIDEDAGRSVHGEPPVCKERLEFSERTVNSRQDGTRAPSRICRHGYGFSVREARGRAKRAGSGGPGGLCPTGARGGAPRYFKTRRAAASPAYAPTSTTAARASSVEPARRRPSIPGTSSAWRASGAQAQLVDWGAATYWYALHSMHASRSA